MFAQCFNLKEVNLSEGIEYIHERAFEDDINLVKVTIPSTVHEIWAPFSMSANPAGKEDCLNNNCYHPKQIVFNNPNGWYINEYDDPNCTKNCSMHKAYFSVEDMSNPTRAAEIVGEHYWIWQDAN